MNRFLSGIVVGALIAVGAVLYTGDTGNTAQPEENTTKVKKPDADQVCPAEKNNHVIRVEYHKMSETISCVYEVNAGEVNEGLVQSVEQPGKCETRGGIWIDEGTYEEVCKSGCSYRCKP